MFKKTISLRDPKKVRSIRKSKCNYDITILGVKSYLSR